ncbi:hypothetical protein BDK51DRAFT_41810 [Blyttiomyces helicus]|uniref:Uncharacterized protein n=1 Tax=Blyttiomyces helicus TaxID=388810 RepID=A0A4P9WLM3_9FUNG|nr:hypothetical protein BDK51DRAFT_41810 [Blyttiomyces helicus]|eukprot:RKO92983.1 hypothetical protein BDK51DRAFT_41810 [Blyttiomyces helicus]
MNHTTTRKARYEFMHAAKAASQRNDWRATADAYRAAVEGASPAFLQRFNCLSHFARIFCEDHVIAATADDLTFIHRIFKSEAQPLPHRVTCGYTLGRMSLRMGDLHTAMKRYSRALFLAESATAAYRSVTVISDGQTVSTGALLEAEITILRRTAEAGKHPLLTPFTHTEFESTIEWDGNQTGKGIDFVVAFGTELVGDDIYEHRLTAVIANRALRVHGKECDGRCKNAAYRSSACQRGAWALHRPSCRPPKTFLPADLVCIAGITSWPYQDSNSFIVEVLRQVPECGNSWSGALFGCARELTGPAVAGFGPVMNNAQLARKRDEQACSILILAWATLTRVFTHLTSGDAAERGGGAGQQSVEGHEIAVAQRDVVVHKPPKATTGRIAGAPLLRISKLGFHAVAKNSAWGRNVRIEGGKMKRKQAPSGQLATSQVSPPARSPPELQRRTIISLPNQATCSVCMTADLDFLLALKKLARLDVKFMLEEDCQDFIDMPLLFFFSI